MVEIISKEKRINELKEKLESKSRFMVEIKQIKEGFNSAINQLF